MYKIYFQNKPLFLIDNEADAGEYLHRADTIYMDEWDSHTVRTMLHQVQQTEVYACVVKHNDMEEMMNAFKEKFRVIHAAGGMVVSENGNVLFIFRKEKWDLPKGKLDEDESLESCAIREVSEETGATSLQLHAPITTTYHTYEEGGENILKETFWYLMSAKEENLEPQHDEGITECKWVSVEELPVYLSNTYQIIRDVVEAGLKMHQAK